VLARRGICAFATWHSHLERNTIMKEATDPKEAATAKTMADIADKALKNYEQIFKTGLKLQEEASKCWTTLLSQTPSAQQFQKPLSNFTAVVNGWLPEAQKRMQEVLDLAEKNSRTGVELIKKAADAAQTPVIAESQSKWMDLWTASMGAVRSNAEALVQLHSRAIESCVDFVQKSSEVTQIRVPKAA
jgi:hypothetical protein